MAISSSPPPNIILKGCTEANEGLAYIYNTILKTSSVSTPREEEISIPGFGSSKQARIIRWPWGIQIWVSPYRNMSEKWWDSLLKLLSVRTATGSYDSKKPMGVFWGLKLIMLCSADTATHQTQLVFRSHLEDDYKTTRYLLTCAKDTYMERSLESRCVIMVPETESRWDDVKLCLETDEKGYMSWDQIKNAWLSDIPAYRVLDNLFEAILKNYPKGSAERKRHLIGWCRYSDLLKACYQEITVLRKAWEWIQKTKPHGKSSE